MKPLSEIGKYATVVIDPPWPLSPLGWAEKRKNGYAESLSYSLMSVDDIAAMPVSDVLDADAFVFVWTVNRHLSDTFGLLDAWNVRYAFTMTWVKNGGIQLPNGPAFNSEWIVAGKKGKPQFSDVKAFNAANIWKRAGNSVKPEGFYDLLRRVTPGPRLDIFGRRRIAGFDSWGNEAPDGPALPDHYQQVLLEG